MPTLAMLMMAASTACISQTFTAYDLQTSTAGTSYAGNQTWSGSIGMAFDVNTAISVTSLGVFDSSRDGFHHVLTTYLWNRDTQSLLASQNYTPAAPGTLDGYHRFISIGSLILDPGHYVISSSGFASDASGTDRNGNELIAGFTSDVFNSGGGAISMVAPGRYSEAGNPSAFPGSTLGSALWVNGPSFQFGLAPVPEPGVWAFMASGSILGAGLLRSRRQKRNISKKVSNSPYGQG